MTEEIKEEEQEFKVLDDDGTEIGMNFGTALGLVRSHSAVVVNNNTIQLNSSLQDGQGFNVRRGWRDDHAENNQAWAYSAQNLERDFLLSFNTLRELYRRSSHIRPAIDSIVKEVAHLPIKVEGEGSEAVEDFIKRPNISKETWPTLIQKFLTDLLILDQAVIEKVRSLSGNIVEIYSRDATQFKPVLDHTRSYITYFRQEATDNTGKVIARVSHDVDDIIWTVQFPRTYSVYGTPIIETIVNEVSTLMFSSQSIARGFVDDEIPNGVLWLDQIGKKAYERAKAQFEASRGEKGKKQLKVIDNVGQAGWIPFTRPFREMQLAELTLIISDIVNKNFGVSSVDLGEAQGLTRSTSDALSKNTRSKLFRPLVNLLTIKLNQELVQEIAPGAELKFVLEPVVDASTAKELSDAGVITKNEARAVLNFPPVAGGDALAVRVGNQYIVMNDDGSVGDTTDGTSGDAQSIASPVEDNKDSVDENDIIDDKKKKKKKEVKEK
jgi:phage portal protein BeeE